MTTGQVDVPAARGVPSGAAGVEAGLERMPPQDVLAEQSVLGGMLLSKDAIADVAEVLQAADFYRPAHEMIFGAILDLFARGEPADPVTVADMLARQGTLSRVGGAPYLHSLVATVPTAANAAYYGRIVRDKAVLRRLVEAGTRIATMGYAADGGEVEDLVNRAQAEVYGVGASRVHDDYRPLSETLEATLAELEEMSGRDGTMTGVPTGFTELDHLTNGLHAGQMIVVAARPAMGKSTVGLDIARSAALHHGLPTVIFSLEMSRTEITTRLLSAEAAIKLQALRTGRLAEDDWTKIARVMGRANDAPLFIDDSPNMTLAEIRAKCRRLRQQHGLKLVVVDYLQLMTSGKRVESRQQEVSEFSRALKLLAKELDVPVIAISQLNRGPEQRTDKRPQMSDLRESGCLTGGTRVLRADTGAETTLEEMYALGHRDVPVWALDDRLRYVRRHLTHVFPTGVRPVFRLRLASGKQVTATANHPFLTYEGWTPLGELAVGTRLAVPRHVPGPERSRAWDDREVVMLARLLGGGSHARRPTHHTCSDPRPVAEWLDDMGLFGARSHEKFLPSAVFHLPKRQIALLLRHLWATDGSVTVHRNGRGGRVYYASTSRRLVDDVSRLLLRFGISCRIRTVRRSGYRGGFTLDISGPDDQRRFLQEIGVHGHRGEAAARLLDIVRAASGNPNVDTVPAQVWDDVSRVLVERGMRHREFAAAMGTQFCASSPWRHGVSRQRLARVAEILGDEDLEIMAVNDVLWDEVMAIDPMGEQQVYDATVLGGHNFVADGIAVHNSIEQDADMVILLHREDAYEKESRPGEADFIVAKHRNGPTDTLTVVFQGHYSRFVDMAR
jgi:replicative DNA helicase